jgi:hypothetical protein
MPSAVITGTPPNACMAFFDLLNGEKFDKTEEGTNLTNLSTGSDQSHTPTSRRESSSAFRRL